MATLRGSLSIAPVARPRAQGVPGLTAQAQAVTAAVPVP